MNAWEFLDKHWGMIFLLLVMLIIAEPWKRGSK